MVSCIVSLVIMSIFQVVHKFVTVYELFTEYNIYCTTDSTHKMSSM
jgi:hypothetical protein